MGFVARTRLQRLSQFIVLISYGDDSTSHAIFFIYPFERSVFHNRKNILFIFYDTSDWSREFRHTISEYDVRDLLSNSLSSNIVHCVNKKLALAIWEYCRNMKNSRNIFRMTTFVRIIYFSIVIEKEIEYESTCDGSKIASCDDRIDRLYRRIYRHRRDDKWQLFAMRHDTRFFSLPASFSLSPTKSA